MYEAFFNLQTSPFPATPLVANYFPAPAIEAARQALIRVIERAEGPGLVIGPAGVGKSLLLGTLAEHFLETFGVVMLSGTRIATRKSLLQSILFELGLSYRGLDEGELRLGLIDALRPGGSFANGILLLIDEAHTLPLRLLDEVRMITNVVRDGQPRARLILAGSQSLEERFANPKLESFCQRIAARCYLQSLSRDETNEYIRAQLSWAGGDPDAILEPDVPRAVFQASDGVPRLINQVCDHALVLAHAHGLERINAHMIQEAWSDLQQLPPPWQPATDLPAMPANTVIEFGELGEARSETPLDPVPMDEPSMESSEFTASSPNWERDEQILADLQALSSVVVGFAAAEEPVEWFDGETGATELAAPHREPNPFESAFEEEVIVIDRITASGVEALRGRTRVRCHATKDLLAQLRASVVVEDDEPPAAAETVIDTVTAPEYSTAFEYSTWESRSEEATEPSENDTGIVHSFADKDHDFEEDLNCVPLPWMRPGGADDRDVIVIEEDLPFSEEVAGDVVAESSSRRMEYRDLFAQLRRATP